MKYKKPNMAVLVFVFALLVMGGVGIQLFSLAMSTANGSSLWTWAGISAIMTWLVVLTVLIVCIELEDIRDLLKERPLK